MVGVPRPKTVCASISNTSSFGVTIDCDTDVYAIEQFLFFYFFCIVCGAIFSSL